MLVTQSSLMQPDWSAALEAALQGGAKLIQMREKEVSAAELLRLAVVAKKLCDRYEAKLVINSDFELAREVGAGVHLRESQSAAQARAFLDSDSLIGQSVHSLQSALRAEQENCDYLVFGSVFATATHPGSVPAGLTALEKVTRNISIPVLAIGGITSANAAHCQAHGAYGVAVIRTVWDAPDIASTTSHLLEVLGA